MKNLSTILCSGLLAAVTAAGALSAGADIVRIPVNPTSGARSGNVLARSEDLDELTLPEMINSVELDKKSAELIRKFQDKEGRNRLHGKEYNAQKNGCTVETYRNKEVLLITIPASKLFAPNETELRREAASLLAPLKRYLKDPDMYRVLLVMHTDNTGSEGYRDNLTEERSTALFDWFVDQGADTRFLFSYAMGDEMPLVPNNSMSNREKNRRLEVYLVPGKKMLEMAKKGRIVFCSRMF